MEIWAEQKHHLPCLQDPPNISLYTTTGHITKNGECLPVLRCARGTTSLESFHLHLARYTLGTVVVACYSVIFGRFIPGTSAKDVHYQAYLLEGLVRWNKARSLAAIQQQDGSNTLRTFNMRLTDKVYM